MTVTTIDRDALRALRTELDAALAAFRDKHPELLLTVGRGVYGGATGHLKLELAIKPADGTQVKNAADVRLAADWNRYASTYKLKPEWLGKTFIYSKTLYQIVGLNVNAHKNAVVIRNVTTKKTLTCTPELITSFLPKEPA